MRERGKGKEGFLVRRGELGMITRTKGRSRDSKCRFLRAHSPDIFGMTDVEPYLASWAIRTRFCFRLAELQSYDPPSCTL
jgi:hypothetical protein